MIMVLVTIKIIKTILVDADLKIVLVLLLSRSQDGELKSQKKLG